MATVFRSVGVVTARMGGDSLEMTAAAEAIAAKARALAGQHRVTGDLAGSIGVALIAGKNGVTDRIAYTDDPAARSIEFGHTTKGGKHVAGLHIMARSI